MPWLNTNMEEFHGLLIIMVVVWLAGKIFRMLNLPVLFGELLGGVIVGPLFLNIVDPNSETIKILAELGIFFLMLHTGLETDPHKLLRSSRKSLFISLASIATTFTMLYFATQAMGFTGNESLIISIGLSITAVTIAVRVFKDTKLDKLPIANTVLSAAIICDIVGLIALSVIFRMIEVGTFDPVFFLVVVSKITLFFAVVIFTGFKTSKYLNKLLANKGFTFSLIVALSLGLIAEELGMHMIIGAFLAGLFIRQEIVDPKVFAKIEDRIFGLSYSFLGPVFFASLAFNLNFSAIAERPWFLIVVLFISFIGHIIGSGLAAFAQKIPAKESFILGLAMNSRGAIDLIIASIAVEKGIISQEVFSVMILVIFLTTLLAILSIKPFLKFSKLDLIKKEA